MRPYIAEGDERELKRDRKPPQKTWGVTLAPGSTFPRSFETYMTHIRRKGSAPNSRKEEYVHSMYKCKYEYICSSGFV
jgi:hypothetical protein